jgi:hypothetical protein
MDLENITIQMGANIQVNGRMICDMVKEKLKKLMVIISNANFKTMFVQVK